MVLGDDPIPSIAAGPRAGLGPYEGMTLAQALATRVMHCPDGRFVSLDDSERSQSYADLWARSGRIAAALAALHLAPASTIVLLTDDGLDFIPVFWACLRAGHIAVPLMSAAHELRLNGRSSAFATAVSIVSPAAVFADPGFHDVAQTALPHCLCLDPADFDRAAPLPVDAAPADTALLLPTSGTTGQVKLVALSQTALLYRAFTTGHAAPETKRTHVGVFPFDSTTGMRCALLQRQIWVRLPMSKAIQTPRGLLDVLARFQASDTSLTNTLAELILATCESGGEVWDLSGLKQVGLGAETVVLSTVRRLDALLQRFGAASRSVRAGYGTTETGVLVAGADPLAPGYGRHTAAALGPCAPNVEIRIVDEVGLIVPQGRTGNVEVRCEGAIFSMYWGDARPAADGVTADGWWRTGDTGLLDEGELFLQGRTKEIIVVNGRKISLTAIDDVLSRAFQGAVAYACAMRSEDEPTERLAIAVTSLDPDVSFESIARIVREAIGHAFGCTTDVVLRMPLPDIPMTATGKVNRNALAERLLSQAKSSPARSTVAQVDGEPLPAAKILHRIWDNVLGPGSAADPHADFYALGGESLRSLQLFSQLNAHFGSRIDPRAFYRRPTLAQLAALLDTAPARSEVPPIAGPEIWPLSAHQHRSQLVFVETWRGHRPTRDRLLVSFNTTGSRPPIFFVCQVEFELRDLAKALGPDQPVHGFRSGHMVATQRETEVQAFALRYVDDLQEIYPEGPILLAGTCQGGVIAQAMAEQLLRRERDVPLLALMDWGFRLRPYAGRVLVLYGEHSHFSNPYRRFHEPDRAWSRRYGDVAAVAVSGAAYSELFDAPYIAETAAALAEACALSLVQPVHHLPIEGRRAAIRLASPPERMTAGQPLTIDVSVRNSSAYPWQETERSGLMLGNDWVDSAGQTVQPSDGRLFLPGIAPGEAVNLCLAIRAPREAGRFLLVVDVVEEGSSWFDPARERGALVTPVEVFRSSPNDGSNDQEHCLSDPHLVIDGKVTCGHVSHDELVFSVPAGARSMRLVSSTGSATPPDIRPLGLLVSRIVIEAQGRVREVALTDPALSTGFFAVERSRHRTWRWTNGNAVVLPTLWAGEDRAFLLRLQGIFPTRK